MCGAKGAAATADNGHINGVFVVRLEEGHQSVTQEGRRNQSISTSLHPWDVIKDGPRPQSGGVGEGGRFAQENLHSAGEQSREEYWPEGQIELN